VVFAREAKKKLMTSENLNLPTEISAFFEKQAKKLCQPDDRL